MPRTNPLIGLTTYGRSPDNRYALPAEYVDAVRRAGGVPVLIAPGETRSREVLGAVDALILTGGGDIDPDAYGGKRHASNYGIDLERDALEIELARQVATTKVPTLGICRGAQILNIAHGGTLIEHLPDEMGEELLHRAPPREPIAHGIRLQPQSRLAQILGRAEFEVVSWHHQALRQVAPAFAVSGHAPDGTVESIEMLTHPWLIAVQWHPEMAAASDPLQQRIFDAIVEAARARAASSRST